MGSLWQIEDTAAAQLVQEFYRQLKENKVSKATALRRAQLKLLRSKAYNHPYFWSPFIMINNWL